MMDTLSLCPPRLESIRMVDFIKKILNQRRQERQAAEAQRQELIKLINNSYETLRVVGRGTVRIDPREVAESSEFRRAQQLAAEIVNAR